MRLHKLRFLMMLPLLLLAACSSSPATRYFLLPDAVYQAPSQNNSPVQSLRVVLAEPLAQSGLLYQSSPVEAIFARQNLWAVPLEHSLAAAFSNHLNRQIGSRYVPHSQNANAPIALTIHIQSFQGSYLGHTTVAGYARHRDGRIQPFHIETPQQGDGYPAMVESLGEGVRRAAQRINP